MAIVNKEVKYDFVQYIEHKTGKRVRSYMREPHMMATRILFYDGTQGIIQEGYNIDSIFEIEPVNRFCLSCGEDMHCSEFDHKGRCSTTIRNFWEKVRKLYWHRYSKKLTK